MQSEKESEIPEVRRKSSGGHSHLGERNLMQWPISLYHLT